MANLHRGAIKRVENFKAQVAVETGDRIRELMIGLAADGMTLCELVAGGPHQWRVRFLREFSHLAVNEYIADQIFKFFAEQVVQRFGPQPVVDDPETVGKKLASQVLDDLEVDTPPTEAEIEKSWKVEIADSDDAMGKFWEGSARTRQGADLGFKRRDEEHH